MEMDRRELASVWMAKPEMLWRRWIAGIVKRLDDGKNNQPNKGK
jgi:hypothetical protein